MCLANFKAMRWFKLPISRLQDFTRSYAKTPYRILKHDSEGELMMSHFPNVPVDYIMCHLISVTLSVVAGVTGAALTDMNQIPPQNGMSLFPYN